MTIELPRLSPRTRFAMRQVFSGSEPLRPAIGGPVLPVDRPGDHWAIEFESLAMQQECGFALLADLVQGRGERVAVRIPQAGSVGPIGNPVVNGAGQSGVFLNIRTLTPQAAIPKGRFLSIKTAGGRFTHMVLAQSIASSAGLASLKLWPMLRVPHADGDVVEIVEPWIEGLLSDGGGFETSGKRTLYPSTVLIEESE